MEAWEAVYRTLLSKYIESKINSPNTLELQEDILSSMESLPKADFVQSFNRRLLIRLNKCLSLFFQDFKAVLQRRAMSDDTWRFWIQFVFQDALAYMGLYLGIRSGDW